VNLSGFWKTGLTGTRAVSSLNDASSFHLQVEFTLFPDANSLIPILSTEFGELPTASPQLNTTQGSTSTSGSTLTVTDAGLWLGNVGKSANPFFSLDPAGPSATSSINSQGTFSMARVADLSGLTDLTSGGVARKGIRTEDVLGPTSISILSTEPRGIDWPLPVQLGTLAGSVKKEIGREGRVTQTRRPVNSDIQLQRLVQSDFVLSGANFIGTGGYGESLWISSLYKLEQLVPNGTPASRTFKTIRTAVLDPRYPPALRMMIGYRATAQNTTWPSIKLMHLFAYAEEQNTGPGTDATIGFVAAETTSVAVNGCSGCNLSIVPTGGEELPDAVYAVVDLSPAGSVRSDQTNARTGGTWIGTLVTFPDLLGHVDISDSVAIEFLEYGSGATVAEQYDNIVLAVDQVTAPTSFAVTATSDLRLYPGTLQPWMKTSRPSINVDPSPRGTSMQSDSQARERRRIYSDRVRAEKADPPEIPGQGVLGSKRSRGY